MATTPAKPDEKDGDGKKSPLAKLGKKKLLIILVALLLVGGGGGYYFLGSSGEEEHEPVAGVVIPLEPITLNLAGGHFLKISIALQATEEAGEHTPDGSKALDLLIAQFSNREVAELATNQARDKAKAELKEKIEAAYVDHATGHHLVMDVYFTEFVMQ